MGERDPLAAYNLLKNRYKGDGAKLFLVGQTNSHVTVVTGRSLWGEALTLWKKFAQREYCGVGEGYPVRLLNSPRLFWRLSWKKGQWTWTCVGNSPTWVGDWTTWHWCSFQQTFLWFEYSAWCGTVKLIGVMNTTNIECLV